MTLSPSLLSRHLKKYSFTVWDSHPHTSKNTQDILRKTNTTQTSNVYLQEMTANADQIIV